MPPSPNARGVLDVPMIFEAKLALQLAGSIPASLPCLHETLLFCRALADDGDPKRGIKDRAFVDAFGEGDLAQ